MHKHFKIIETEGVPLFPAKERNWIGGNNLYMLRNMKSNHLRSHLLLLMQKLPKRSDCWLAHWYTLDSPNACSQFL